MKSVFMVNFKKLLTLFLFISLIGIGIAATSPPRKRTFKNLKVLPKKIGVDELNDVMNNFRDALGVDCNFCHVPVKDSSASVLNFASDDKPEKEITRKMMRMTSKINKKYFNAAKNEKFKETPAVSCITCHHRKAQAGEKR
jgi:nitrate/TMAO reductase-like tetraheme cytochrome c subunit